MVSQKSTSQVVRVCTADELPPGEVRQVPVNPPIAVYNVDGEFYATADLCTHDRSSLSEEGYIEDGEIECGWHMARFCIKTGEVTSPPATQPLASYKVEVEDGQVFVLLGPSDPC